MQPGPSRTAEAIVGLVIPPACREHVLGDLHERYSSPVQYFADVLSTVPWVIVSRIRRTTDAAVFLMEAFALYISFLAAPWYLGQHSFLYDEFGLLRLAIPVAVALVALVLGDAYGNTGKRSSMKPIQETALSIGFAFLSEAMLSTAHPDWVVPRGMMISGGCLSLLFVSTVRTFFPPDTERPRGAR